jgi:hypothetical protein
MSIVPGGYQYQLWPVVLKRWDGYACERGLENRVARAGRYRDIDGVASANALTTLHDSTCAREKLGLMCGNVKNSVGAVELSLRPVAMVSINIHNANPAEAQSAQSVLRATSDIIEKAEAIRTPPQGVMAWWPHKSQCASDLAQHHRLDTGYGCANSCVSCSSRVAADVIISIEEAR